MSYIAKFQQNETGQRVLSMRGSNPREISELLEYLGVADKERMAPLVVKNVGVGVVQFAKKFDGTPKPKAAEISDKKPNEKSDKKSSGR